MKTQIVLASGSDYRRQLLGKLLADFEIGVPAIDESRRPGEPVEPMVRRLALAKARALVSRFPRALIIGSDQAAALDGEILTKPGNYANARGQLSDCSGRRVVFQTGLCLLDAASGEYDLVCEPYTVHFRELSEDEISAYLRREQPYDCAGSFKAEGLGISLFLALEGKDPNALVGLPLISLGEMLRKRGINPLL